MKNTLSTEDEFEVFFHNSVDLLAIADLDGYFKRLNKSWQQTLGWTIEELCARPWLEFVHPDDHELTISQAERLSKGQSVLEFVNRYRCKDGNYKWLSWRVTAPKPGSSRLYATARDMTAQKQAADLISQVVDASPTAMVLVNSKGSIHLVNSETEKLFGYDREELLGEPLDLLVPESVREKHRKLQNEFLAHPQVRPMGSIGRLNGASKEGNILPLEIGLNPITIEGENFVLAAVVNIAEHERRLELEKIRAGLEASIMERERYTIRLVARSEVTRALSEAESFDEVAPQILKAVCESMDWVHGEVWTPEIREQHMNFICGWHLPGATDLAEFEDVARENKWNLAVGIAGRVQSRGQAEWLSDIAEAEDCPRRDLATQMNLHGVFAFPVIAEDKVSAVMVFFSRRREQPDENLLAMMADFGHQIGQFIIRQNLRSQLEQSQKVESVGRLAGGIAHDFNNLLTVINGYSELVMTKLERDDPLSEDIKEILNAGERASTLTRQLLAFSRKQVLVPKVTSINDIVSNMQRMLARLIGEDVILKSLLAPDLNQVKVDPGQIEQVIMNLAVNARDAMPKGGKLTIETANVQLDGLYAKSHAAVTPGDYVMLAISDNGVGMDKETQKQIFEPFFTTKEMGKGTGLGLATVHGIVKQSDGHIWTYSEPGKGTTFKIYFPSLQEAAISPELSAAAEIQMGHELILLVEDEVAVRKLAINILTSAGYEVVDAGNGPEAIELFLRHGDAIKLLVTDVIMPGMSGQELYLRLSGLRPGLPVLYMSGYTNDSIVDHGVLEDGIAFVQKPFSHKGLLSRIRDVLNSA